MVREREMEGASPLKYPHKYTKVKRALYLDDVLAADIKKRITS